jgi:hypothetical protein
MGFWGFGDELLKSLRPSEQAEMQDYTIYPEARHQKTVLGEVIGYSDFAMI